MAHSKQMRRQHPAWRLLAADSAPLITSFLHRVFIVPNVRVMSQSDLVEALEDALFALRDQRDGDPFPKGALEYLNDWAANERGWLRKFYPPGSDEPHFDLTPATEKAIAWVAGLAERSFVGTESRLLTLFELLRQMNEGQRGRSAGARARAAPAPRHRVIGANVVPDEAWVDTLDDALRLIGKHHEARAFEALIALTRPAQPPLLPWLQANSLRALTLADDWPRLLDVVAWLRSHPRPGIYLRAVDLPGVHSKFIEAHRAVLAELLDLALPAHAIDGCVSASASFAQRYGFRVKPVRVRFRVLDPGQSLPGTGSDEDVAVGHETFARLNLAASRVFITENETNFLAFPPVADGLVVFGAGYGFEMLAAAHWLHGKTIHYWGDIDTHGFAILDQLRSHFAHVESFLMDRETLITHRPQWTEELQPTLRDLPRLNTGERALYDDLRWKRLADLQVRLEQERIGFHRIEEAAATID